LGHRPSSLIKAESNGIVTILTGDTYARASRKAPAQDVRSGDDAIADYVVIAQGHAKLPPCHGTFARNRAYH
jgi:hypothetical protein